MANKVYQHDEAALTWDAAGTTELFTPTSLGAAAGRQGVLHDFGTGARSRLFAWRAWLVPGATRVVGEVIRVYLKTSDGTTPDNDDGTGDIAVSSVDKLRNVRQIGAIIIDENAAVAMAASGYVALPARYGAPIFWNATANSLSATAGDFGFSLTPVPDEVQ
jgi:hypothetical protein